MEDLAGCRSYRTVLVLRFLTRPGRGVCAAGSMGGDLDRLRARADADHLGDAWELTELLANQLIKQGRGEEAERLRRFGLNPDGSIACA